MYEQVIFASKHEEPNGDIIQIRIWEVAKSEEYPDGIRHSLVYIRDGQRLLGYDNFHGKGHNRHVRDREEAYDFVDEWKLLEDFMSDCEKIKRGVIK